MNEIDKLVRLGFKPILTSGSRSCSGIRHAELGRQFFSPAPSRDLLDRVYLPLLRHTFELVAAPINKREI